MTNVAVIMFCLVCIAYLYGVDYSLDLRDKEVSRILKCEKERRINAMAETKREIYIRRIEEILRHENMSICHEAFFTEGAIREILELLKEEPRVIMCKDCIHYPNPHADCPMIGWARNENDFCSKVERKDDD